MSTEGGLIKAPTPPYREGTEFQPHRFNFIYNCGGIGDYIQWTPAIRWAILNHPYLSGYIHTPRYFEELARLWLSDLAPRYEIISGGKFEEDERIAGKQGLAPDLKQFANASGMHLFTLGWVYYTQSDVVQKGFEVVPEIRGDEAPVSRFNLPENYACIPITATAANRRLTGRAIEEISKYLVKKGITPVYLGKKELAADYSGTAEECDLSYGIDLREQTNLIQAACVMAHSRLTLGLDGGLLHLAACTKAPVIMGFTSVDPRVRVPPRKAGRYTAVLVPPRSLPCRFCNTEMRFLLHHDFANCLYKDDACAKMLGVESFIPAIERTLTESEKK